MSSSRPYLIRAMYEWIVDNGMTPHLLVAASHPDVMVPSQYVDDGKIVLNVSPSAVRDLDMGNGEITFSGRFGGKPMNCLVPVECALAIYTRENGKGMVFAPEDGGTDPENTQPPDNDGDGGPPAGSKQEGGRSHLRVVK